MTARLKSRFRESSYSHIHTHSLTGKPDSSRAAAGVSYFVAFASFFYHSVCMIVPECKLMYVKLGWDMARSLDLLLLFLFSDICILKMAFRPFQNHY